MICRPCSTPRCKVEMPAQGGQFVCPSCGRTAKHLPDTFGNIPVPPRMAPTQQTEHPFLAILMELPVETPEHVAEAKRVRAARLSLTRSEAQVERHRVRRRRVQDSIEARRAVVANG